MVMNTMVEFVMVPAGSDRNERDRKLVYVPPIYGT